MDQLLEAINDYLHNHGYYPKVKMGPEFANRNQIHFAISFDNCFIIEIDETVDQWELE